MLKPIFKTLPDVLIQIIIDYVNETPFLIFYDDKKRKWIHKANPEYALLNKVCKFRIENPPEIVVNTLCITLPIKAPYKMVNMTDDGYIFYVVTIHYGRICRIELPIYYKNMYKTLIRKYKQKLRKKKDVLFRNRCKNMINALKECNVYDMNSVHMLYDYNMG